MTDAEEIERLLAGSNQVYEDPEITRLSTGIPPARAADSEIERVLYGKLPTTERNDQLVLSNAAETTHWGENTLTGPSGLRVGGAEFWIPDNAEVKASPRSLTTWVRHEGRVYVYSSLGLLHQSDDDRAAASTAWDLL